jgi:pyruvate dehydrogenase E2 component (dihydrolipoamide acetyltransferase)
MPTPVIVPKATLSMETGEIVKWLKVEGDAVRKDELLFELETDKAIVEVPSPADGVLLRVLISAGPAKVEQVVGWIGKQGEPVQTNSTRVMATPAARRRASELGVELSAVTGTGPGGRITQEDVEKLPTRSGPAEQHRSTLIRHLTAAWQVPHIHISRELDAGGLIATRRDRPGLSVTDLLLYALSRLLPEFGQLTQFWRGEKLEPAAQIHLAFAVDTPRGVVTPVIRNIGELSLEDIGNHRRRLSEAAREHRLRPDEIEGGVFTLTNLGMHEVDFFAPVINAPQTAILATGRVKQQPVVIDNAVGVGWRMWANLALDHRVADGAYAARFLAQLQDRLNRLQVDIQNT